MIEFSLHALFYERPLQTTIHSNHFLQTKHNSLKKITIESLFAIEQNKKFKSAGELEMKYILILVTFYPILSFGETPL